MKMGRRPRCSSVTYRFRYAPLTPVRLGPPCRRPILIATIYLLFRGQDTSITLLSRVVDFFRECSVAVGTMSGRSQQPRPDRFEDLLQRQTRSFFLPQGRWSG